MEQKAKEAHILLVAYPTQGHINPMLQFGKRLASKAGVKATLATTISVSRTMHLESGLVQIDTISDGYDEEGFVAADSGEAYVARFKAASSRTLSELIVRYSSTHPIDCVVYDSIVYWALDVAKKHGLAAASFFTQACAVNNLYYYIQKRFLPLPFSPTTLISIPGLPFLPFDDLPSFVSKPEKFPAYTELCVNQFSNLDKADFVFVNTVYELEEQVIDLISDQYKFLAIGPTVPSLYSDNRIENDKAYGLSLYTPEHETCISWLNTKPPNSVLYAALGSIAEPAAEEMAALAWALKASNYYFMWVLRPAEQERLPKNIMANLGEKGIVVKWSPQLEVLASEAVGCFLTHCGWNSTVEALCLGVPMVAMPQIADQQTNAKIVEDVWKVGKRVRAGENGILSGEEIVGCIEEVMHGEKAEVMKANARRLSGVVKGAISEGGTSDRNINEFVSTLLCKVE